MPNPTFSQSLDSLFPALWRGSVGMRVIVQPSLTDRGDGRTQLVRQIFVSNSAKQGISRGLEVHVCTPIDKTGKSVYHGAYKVKGQHHEKLNPLRQVLPRRTGRLRFHRSPPVAQRPG